MEKFHGNVQDAEGNAINNAEIIVVNSSSQVQVAVYEDDESTPISQPIFTDSLGEYEFKASNNTYDIQITYNAVTKTLENISLHDQNDDPAINWSATNPPTATDDENAGYSQGSLWYYSSAGVIDAYRCLVAASASAVWARSTLNIDDLGTMAVQDADGVSIHGGSIDNVTIGASTPAAGTFTVANASTLNVSGSTIFSGYFQSPGIVDNASAVVITIASSGNVGIGVTPEDHHSSRDVVQIGLNGSLQASNSGNQAYLGNNFYTNGAGTDSYISTDEASRIYQNQGSIILQVAASGTADTAITWDNSLTIDNSGNVGLGKTPETWNSTFTALHIGGNASLRGYTAEQVGNIIVLANNAYDDGSTKYITTDEASDYYQLNGAHVFRVAPSGTADTAISFTTALTLNNSGNATFGGDVDMTSGNPTAPTQTAGSNNTRVATTAFVASAVSAGAGASEFASGTRMMFQQNAAPTGWTKETAAAYGDAAFKNYNGTLTATGGSTVFSTAFNNNFSTTGGSVGNTSISTAQMAAHQHLHGNRTGGGAVIPNFYGQVTVSSNIGTQSVSNQTKQNYTQSIGSGSTHTHTFTNPTFNQNVKWIGTIVAEKD